METRSSQIHGQKRKQNPKVTGGRGGSRRPFLLGFPAGVLLPPLNDILSVSCAPNSGDKSRGIPRLALWPREDLPQNKEWGGLLLLPKGHFFFFSVKE